jgi:hypothetical protein
MVVGALFSGKGNVVCLPNIEWDKSAFVNKKGDEWAKAAETFTYVLRDQIFGIDAALRASGEITPEPDWAKAGAFRLAIEGPIENEILKLGQDIETLRKLREEKRQSLRESGSLRALLFEKGKPLEAAVRDALTLLGFDVSHFKEGDSEFDAVFISPEGRFLGEVEGKDSKAINVEKYSQLERNINEDLSKEDVTEPAKGVLFGNAYRLILPSERDAFFTDKVLAAAKRTGCALVRTPDLFVVARHLKDRADEDFASACRNAIAKSAGAIVAFPIAPESEPDKISDS